MAAHILLLTEPAMKSSSQTRTLADSIIDRRRLIAGLRHALEVNYARVLASAQTRWELDFAGKDPSDACVRVRISSGQPLTGLLRKSPKSILNGAGRRLLA